MVGLKKGGGKWGRRVLEVGVCFPEKTGQLDVTLYLIDFTGQIERKSVQFPK